MSEMQQDSSVSPGLPPNSYFPESEHGNPGNESKDSLVMKAANASPSNLGTFPSPGSPNFLDSSVEYRTQGWSSERVPLPASLSSSLYSRRQTSFSSLMPYHSGRTMPSKWVDAERWITSPSSNAFLTNRRPLSRSGPIGQSKPAFYSNNYSPNFQGFQSGRAGYSLALHRSPISSGLMSDKMDDEQIQNENGMHHPVGQQRFSDLLSESSASAESSQHAKLEQFLGREGEVPKRDMATQMSPGSRNSSSSKGWPASVMSQDTTTAAREETFDESNKRLEERDVQVDKWAAILRWSKRHGVKLVKRDLPEVVGVYKTTVVEAHTPSQPPTPPSPWDVAALAKKFERDEAKITAWQNLQKAKTEAAVRKLEMKLEKRSESMDKIIKKFKKAENKSQNMRRKLSEERARHANHNEQQRVSQNALPSPVSIHVGSFSCCFTCHAL